jgi:antirestriction protein ArdC
MHNAAPRADIYTRVTDKIVADLERGCRTWLKPWSVQHAAGKITRPLRVTGEPYNGINILMLWSDAVTKSFSCPTWMTYRQANELGANVRKGEHGSPVVYANRITRTETNSNGEEIENEIPFLKGYTVFNCEQIEGLPERFYPTAPPALPTADRIACAECFASSTSAEIRHGGNRAYYSCGSDHVQLPPFECFRDVESYYATLLHELTHWTKHETRLNREFGRKRWGDEGYAAEELVAELGAAFLCADLGITPEPREDHAAYLASWLKVLKNDKRAIFTAAAHAQRAGDHLHSLQRNAEG